MMTDPFRKIAEDAHFNVYMSDLWNGTGQRFARAIVQECIECVEGYTKTRTDNTHYDAVEQIKAHFGIG